MIDIEIDFNFTLKISSHAGCLRRDALCCYGQDSILEVQRFWQKHLCELENMLEI